MNRLELRHVRKAFEGLDVLADISLSVGAGDFVSILGPSGAGKSTLFQLLTGALHGEGEIFFDDKPLDDHGGHFAFMPQRDALMPWRRILDNATLGLEVQGVRRKAARARVAPLFEEFGLAGFERHFPAQLSGGMRQRAALLRTVVQERDMLLLDEPFGALDALTRAAMQRWLEQMWRRHCWTALLITHDVREAVFLSDRIYVLSARPARVVAEITVPLPRPRELAGGAARQAGTLEAQILDILLNPSHQKDMDHD
ncbi:MULTISPECIES: ABC transporter ATP-binding protein [unclassified Mesorhizobium]|uniref:ABC transporter ATP-binding protein n=1 Tax=unclassified Mesorhizobium TaxID=325217 RepID=UPI00112CCDA0|nr:MULTISPECIES: ABC transporter ATP-binding protein [unclassified Mesorhizobium]MBZ9897989.1 ABC transporter ATP-binding protein [Mesorhizobium sp. BR1-1-6]TPJ64720.1 ABC transporter ATP-binding protein [Mesorhizobium sp. B2-6-1]